MREELTWFFIGAVALSYMSHRNLSKARVKLRRPPSSQNEVDPTRWRHDGTQRLMWRDGNRRLNRDFPTERSLFEVLAF